MRIIAAGILIWTSLSWVGTAVAFGRGYVPGWELLVITVYAAGIGYCAVTTYKVGDARADAKRAIARLRRIVEHECAMSAPCDHLAALDLHEVVEDGQQ